MNRRVLVTIPWYVPAFRAGGPVQTIQALIAEHGHANSFAVLTGDRDWGRPERLPVEDAGWVDVGHARVRYCSTPTTGRALRSVTAALLRLRPHDVVYCQGVFPVVFSMVPAALFRLGLLRAHRLVIAPRGEFGAGALAIGAEKKRLYLAVAKVTGLYAGAVWHASSPREERDIRRALGDVRIVVRENETLLPEAPQPVTARQPGPLRIVFVSRISEKKGLHVLLEALAHVDTPVRLDVVGSTDDPPYLDRCRRLADACGHAVTFHGPVDHEDVIATFASADLFAFPTADENFGHAIAESLAGSCPVLLPDTTPWSDLLRQGGGEVLEAGMLGQRQRQTWAEAITRWATRSDEALGRARSAAADAYLRWRAERPTGSVFDLIDAREA